MIISLLVAMDEERGIGKDNQMPWHLSTDLKRFKALTMGHYILMGRKTFEAIGRPLPGRNSVIITRDEGYQAPGCTVVNSLDQALQLAESNGEAEAIIIGGGSIFAQVMPQANRIYLTEVHAIRDCDVFFPYFNKTEWEILEQSDHPADEQNDFPTTYKLLTRKQPNP